MEKHESVDEYLADLAEPFKQVAERMHTIIDVALPESPVALSDGDPTWSLGPVGTSPICRLKASPNYLIFILWHGQEIQDPSGRLEPGEDLTAHVKLRTMDDIDEVLFDVWIREARSSEIRLTQSA